MADVGVGLRDSILARLKAGPRYYVWTPVDFLDLGARGAVDKALQRLVRDGELRRIDRGLYDRPWLSSLTEEMSSPDYRAAIEAIARRDQIRVLIDGFTAANDIGLSDAVPARVVVHTDARLRDLKFGKMTIKFRPTAPSKLYWAGRPAMRVVQALHWLRDVFDDEEEQDRVRRRLRSIFADPQYGAAIQSDLRDGMSTLPVWMQDFLRGLLDQPRKAVDNSKPSATPQSMRVDSKLTRD
jgi:Family of unknown function (DUF6088)